MNNLRDAAIRRFGAVDVWINNAGRGIGKKVLELTEEDLDTMIAVNVKTALYGMQPIVPHFQELGGFAAAPLPRSHRKQPGDPVRAAAAIVDVLESSNPPLRLVLGADAVDRVRAKLAAVERDVTAWERVGRSITYSASGQ